MKGVSSARTNVLNGVSQSSVLGPLIFTSCIIDTLALRKNLDCRCYMYAASMKVYHGNENSAEVDIIQNNLAKVIDWTERWLITLNIPKREFLRLSDKNIK